MKKEKEATGIGCVIGVCAMVSHGCYIARLVLCKLNGLWNGVVLCRGEEGGPEGAGGGQ